LDGSAEWSTADTSSAASFRVGGGRSLLPTAEVHSDIHQTTKRDK